ncbi:MAG: hydroxymethylglutaryl-CoA reductase, degradative [Pseudomonadota bacterium]
MPKSEIHGLYELTMAERRAQISKTAELTDDELRVLSGKDGLNAEQADCMAENAVGVTALPLCVCLNLRVNDQDCLVPMATEEPSVVAAASYAAKLLRNGHGIQTKVSPSHMIGQIQILDVPNPTAAENAILEARAKLLEHANAINPILVEVGGGAIDVEVRHLPPMDANDPVGDMLIVHLIVDVRDAMGANTINSMCEHLAPELEKLSGGRVRLRILSNLADRRIVVATGHVSFATLEGKGCDSPQELARGIEEASVFAERDPYRATTHNKGIMNGVDSVLLAFSQDWRAVEAGAHAFAARNGRYTALSRWRVVANGIYGRLELPMAVGTVGGVTGVHPTVRITRKLARVHSASDLASITAAVGLAQNLGALRALAAEGIQNSHMRLHARNVAVEVGALCEEIHQVAHIIADKGAVNLAAARETLRQLRAESKNIRPSQGRINPTQKAPARF